MPSVRFEKTGYASRGFRERKNLPAGWDQSMEQFECKFHDHPLTPNTLVLTEVTCGWEADPIMENLKDNGLKLLNHGWHTLGFAISFRKRKHAAMFRMLYTGKVLNADDAREQVAEIIAKKDPH
jgi:uncharacterized protein YbdZ (MbtH family)